MPRWRRWVLARCGFCLFLGAILAFGVSWWCGWKVLYGLDADRDRAHRHTRNAVIDPDIYHVNGAAVYVIGVLRTTGATRVTFRALRPDLAQGIDQGDPQQFDVLWQKWGPTPASWGPQRLLGYGATEQVLPERPFSSDMHFEARGWPMLATWCEFHGSVQGGFHLGLGHIPGTFATTDLVLPYRIIWFGFGVNTMFYASIVGAIAFGPGALRRRWRIRHHRCTACGYPIGESERCSECGAAVVRHRSALQAAITRRNPR
jgi:hypothetical protein